MNRSTYLKFPLLCICALLTTIFLSSNVWAIKDAVVVADQAIIYADDQMSAPVGFVRKGKKIKIGDYARNKGQVYPVIVAGKLAYIRAFDLTTERESVDSQVIVAERFHKRTVESVKSNYTVSAFNYLTQITVSKENDVVKNKDPVNWVGASVRGGAQMSRKWDIDIIFNALNGTAKNEVYAAIETGIGGAARIYEKSRLKLKLLVQFLAIPFASYSLADEFRVNGYGYTAGGGLSMTYRFGDGIGLEVYSGIYHTQLSGFQAPEPYVDIAPSFTGNRTGVGLNYQF